MPKVVKVDSTCEMKWGLLVKSWATMKSYIPGVPDTNIKVPQTMDEFKQQCALAGIPVHVEGDESTGIQDPGLVIPKGTKFQPPIVNGPDMLFIKLPSAERVVEAEHELMSGGDAYALPAFYRRYLAPDVQDYQAPTLSKEHLLELHACRIGDYSISHCG